MEQERMEQSAKLVLARWHAHGTVVMVLGVGRREGR